MEVTLHATPRWSDVILEQIQIVGLSLWREALVVAAVLGIGTVLIVGEIVSGGPGFDSRERFPTALIAFLFPFAVWRGERRFGPGFLWTLPVDRRTLALVRVFAGWVWLMVALAFFVTWLSALALIGGAGPVNQIERITFLPTMAAYLFGSAIVLGLRHPLRWILGAAGLLFVMGMLSDVFAQPDDGEWRYVPGARVILSASGHALGAWLSLSDPARWAITTFIPLGAGLIALWAAASRHRELRR